MHQLRPPCINLCGIDPYRVFPATYLIVNRNSFFHPHFTHIIIHQVVPTDCARHILTRQSDQRHSFVVVILLIPLQNVNDLVGKLKWVLHPIELPLQMRSLVFFCTPPVGNFFALFTFQLPCMAQAVGSAGNEVCRKSFDAGLAVLGRLYGVCPPCIP